MIASLSKFWRPISEEDYWHKMDIPMTNNAVIVSGFPKEVKEWIWEIERQPFEIFT